MKHKGLGGSEEIMTDKQRKEEKGTMPKSKGWVTVKKSKRSQKGKEWIEKESKEDQKEF